MLDEVVERDGSMKHRERADVTLSEPEVGYCYVAVIGLQIGNRNGVTLLLLDYGNSVILLLFDYKEYTGEAACSHSFLGAARLELQPICVKGGASG